MSSSAKPRVVIAGQVPPPTGGQNVMIARLLEQLRESPELQVAHLPFYFTRNFQQVRSAGLGKLWEIVCVIARLLRLRWEAPIDLLIFPPGGPQNVPLIRDLLLLPWILLFSKKTVLHFHAAGIGDRLQNGEVVPRIARWFYRWCDAAIVMTDYNRKDPEACGIRAIHVIPHQLDDEFEASLVNRQPDEFRILYMGHLCPDKGTPVLLEAFASVAKEFPQISLELAGEPLPPYSFTLLRDEIQRLGIADRVHLPGVVKGEAKKRAFGSAHLFVFPSVAPYESFGLVMVEAMMWGLPLIVSDWRGNRDVAGPAATYVSPTASFTTELAAALRAQIVAAESLPQRGQQSRERYETHFRLQREMQEFPRLVLDILNGPPKRGT